MERDGKARENKKLNANMFGIGVYHPKHEINIGTLIRSAYIFGANYVFTVGRRYKRQSSEKGFAEKYHCSIMLILEASERVFL